MTEIEKKALELVNEVQAERNHAGSPWNSPTILNEALYRAIEQHESFRQEVSDAVEQAVAFLGTHSEKLPRGQLAIALARFIISKPDPLADALRDSCEFPASDEWVTLMTSNIRAALAKRGLEIREVSK